MDKFIAARLDGMLFNVAAALDGIAHFMKANLSDADYEASIALIGGSMAGLAELSSKLYAEYPEIVPDKMK